MDKDSPGGGGGCARLYGATLYPVESRAEARGIARGLRSVNPKWTAWQYHGRGKEPARWVFPCGVIEGGPASGAVWVPSSAGKWVAREEPRPLADGIAPYWYQSEAVEAVQRGHGGVVEAPCGAGKTGIGTFLASRVDGRVLVLVHTLDLLRQWVERLSTWLPSVSVGRIGGGKRQPDRDVVVASLSTLARWSWDDLSELGRGFGLLIADECHRVPAETWVRVVAALPCTARVGLTATPKRKDGLHSWMHLALGPTVYRIEQRTLDESGRTMAPDIRLLSTGHEVVEGNHAADTMRNALEDPQRQAVLVGCVRRLVDDGRRVLVLTSLVSHAQETAEAVGGVALVGQVSARGRAAALDGVRAGDVRVVVATQLADEGLDLPEVDAVVLAAPSSHRPATRQRIGRGCRALPGKRTPVVVDLRDEGRWATRKASARDALYREMGWASRWWR